MCSRAISALAVVMYTKQFTYMSTTWKAIIITTWFSCDSCDMVIRILCSQCGEVVMCYIRKIICTPHREYELEY